MDNQRLAVEGEQRLRLPHTGAFAAGEDNSGQGLGRHKKNQKSKGKSEKAKV
jgi:hypothetical protein